MQPVPSVESTYSLNSNKALILRNFLVSAGESVMERANSHDIAAAVAWLKQGKLVAFPTETVYGLGADARDPESVAKIFRAKGRPTKHPLIVHLADANQLPDWCGPIPEQARKLAATFWPGPMTLILQRGKFASDAVTGGLSTVGIRVPSHPVAQSLLREFGGGIAAPSANRFGRVSPTTAEHVRAENFDPQEVLILAGDACEIGLESTIIDLSRGIPAVLRPGAITAEQIAACLASPLGGADFASPRCSGSLESHYAPQARVRLFEPHQKNGLQAELQTALHAGERLVLIAPAEVLSHMTAVENMQRIVAPDTAEAFAQKMYAMLREADQLGNSIFILPPEETGLGVAIWDRLRKAAAPRE